MDDDCINPLSRFRMSATAPLMLAEMTHSCHFVHRFLLRLTHPAPFFDWFSTFLPH